jgi:prophage antirepressor-like protein
MAQDICRLLGISNHSIAVNKEFRDSRYTLAGVERKLKAEFTGTSRRQILLVNTGGLYKLIMQADSLVAREIQERAVALKNRNQFC